MTVPASIETLEVEDRVRRFEDFAPAGHRQPVPGRPVVCVQGLGFVGAAMAVVAARARDASGEPCFNVLGVDLEEPKGRAAVESLNRGELPFTANDPALEEAVAEGRRCGNLIATTDEAAYGLASVILIDINLDLAPGFGEGAVPSVELCGLRRALRTIGRQVTPGALVIVETTVPPGTCEKIVAPVLAEALVARDLKADDVLIAHSYERVMPGADYLDSIVNYWRVYAGHTPAAAEACAAFLGKIVNTERYPLTRLESTTASETAKVLENSYRAVNIAFMEEWGRFAEAAGIDLFEVVDAIRRRPSHSNLRQPGFGVGGYCLPKDPLLAAAAARDLFDFEHLDFPFCRMAVDINRDMPVTSVEALEALLDGSLLGKRVLLLGVSYRPDVADTRHSPAEVFLDECERRGASLTLHDPLVPHWAERDRPCTPLPASLDGFDAVVFAVAHAEYGALDLPSWFAGAHPAVLDANKVLSGAQRAQLRELGCQVASIGRGGTL